MTNAEVVQKAIEKANKNGYNNGGYLELVVNGIRDKIMIVGYYKSSHKDVVKNEVVALEKCSCGDDPKQWCSNCPPYRVLSQI